MPAAALGDITEAGYAKAANHLSELRQQWAEIAPSERIREVAQLLVRRHPMSAADALELAAALEWSEEHPLHRPFLCLDRRLAEAARTEDFQVETA